MKPNIILPLKFIQIEIINKTKLILDNIIELIEFDNAGFNIGVQWHPEFITNKSEQNLIFQKFVEHINKNRL